jgi:hypothetical protein
MPSLLHLAMFYLIMSLSIDDSLVAMQQRFLRRGIGFDICPRREYYLATVFELSVSSSTSWTALRLQA